VVPNILTVYRVKNESRWISKSLDTISEISSSVIILDNGSTDDTVKICKSNPNVVEIIEQSNMPFDEARDRNILLKKALALKPDYILTLDGDEILMPNSKEILEEELDVLYTDYHIFSFQFLYMWDKFEQFRYDGLYHKTWLPRLIRLADQPENLTIDETSYPGNTHASGIPGNAIGQDVLIKSNVKILHYGYFDDNLRQNKFQFYNKLMPNNKEQDGYKHAISGNGIHSGPYGMEFKILPKGLYYENL